MGSAPDFSSGCVIEWAAMTESTGHRWGVAALAVVVALLIGYPLFRTFESRNDTTVVTATSIDALGEGLYLANCAVCHGAGGEEARYSALTTAAYLASTTDAELTAAIAEGVPGTTMRAFGVESGGELTVIQVQAVVSYLRSLATTEAP